MKKHFAVLSLAFALMSITAKSPAYDANGFNPSSLPSTLCLPAGLCDVTFAKDFPTFPCCGTFSVFAIAFMPNGNVFVADNAPGANFLYIFPTDQAPGTVGVCPGPGQPTGVLGYDGSATSIYKIANPDYTSLNGTTRGILDFVQLPNGKIYADVAAGTPPFGRIVELTAPGGVFTTGPDLLPAGVDVVGGAAYDPASGGIFYADTANNIHSFDPATGNDVVLGNYPFAQSDGIVVRQDSCLATLDQVYFADLGGNNVIGFNVTRGALGVPTSVTFAQALCSGFSSPDGLAMGLPGSCLQNLIFANSNSGSMYFSDLNAPSCANFATGGARGDFVKVSGKGWLYATQSSSITEIRDSASSTPLWSDQIPCSCQNVKQFACSLSAGGCVPGTVLASITAACAAASGGNTALAGTNMLNAIDQLCPTLGVGTADCISKKRALIAEMAQFMECQGLACGAAVLAAHCPSVTLPSYPFSCVITPSPTPTFTVVPTACPVAIGVRNGENSVNYTDTLGNLWQTDRPYDTFLGNPFGFVLSTGFYAECPASTYQCTFGSTGPLGTPDPQIYKADGYGPAWGYRFNVPNGTYNVSLRFLEAWDNLPGQRVMNISAQGVPIYTNFDILTQVPKYTALDKNFTVAVTAGILEVDFVALVDMAFADGIRISCISLDTPTPTPTMPSPNFNVQLQQATDNTAANTSSIDPNFQVLNTGTVDIDASKLTIQYWYNKDAPVSPQSVTIQSSAVVGSFRDILPFSHAAILPTDKGGQTEFAKFSFDSGAGIVHPGEKIVLAAKITNSNATVYDQTNDYSFVKSKQLEQTQNTTVYYGGFLVWGVEPSHVGTPSPTPQPKLRLQYATTDRSPSTTTIKPDFRLYNDGKQTLGIGSAEVRYWFTEEGTASQSASVSTAKYGSSGEEIASGMRMLPRVLPTSLGGQTHYVSYHFGPHLLKSGDYLEVHSQLQKDDTSVYDQCNDYSFGEVSKFRNWKFMTVYFNDVLVWGTEPSGTSFNHGSSCGEDVSDDGGEGDGGNHGGDGPSASRLMPKDSRSSYVLPEGKNLLAVPNPAKDQVTVYFRMEQAGKAYISLVDLAGTVLTRKPLGDQPAGSDQGTIDLKAYASGVYYVVLESDLGYGTAPRERFKMAIVR